jgi:hypothetical protein
MTNITHKKRLRLKATLEHILIRYIVLTLSWTSRYIIESFLISINSRKEAEHTDECLIVGYTVFSIFIWR